MPRYVLDRVADGWGNGATGHQFDQIDTATAVYFTSQLYRSQPAKRATVAPLEVPARLVAAEIGCANVSGVEKSIRRHLSRGWLVREWNNGTTARYSLNYAALEAERGNFVLVTCAEAGVIQFGERTEQATQARIVLAADANAPHRSEADIRLDSFNASRGAIEAALVILEECGTIEVTRSRLRGNSYLRTRGGAFTNERMARRSELIQAARAHRAGRPRTKTPVRNRTTPRCDSAQNPGAKPHNIEEQLKSPTEQPQQARDRAGVVVSLGSGMGTEEQRAAPDVERIKGKIRAAGVKAIPTGAVAYIIQGSHEPTLDTFIEKSRADGSGPGLVVAYLKSVLAGEPWQAQRTPEAEPTPDYMLRDLSREEVA